MEDRWFWAVGLFTVAIIAYVVFELYSYSACRSEVTRTCTGKPAYECLAEVELKCGVDPSYYLGN